MKRKLFKRNSKILARPQKSILSAATIIMVMVSLSRVLGLVRNRILAHFFSATTLSVYFAAFRLPEMFFEVLVLGTFSSAFIPVFTAYFRQGKKREAWGVAAMSLNLAFLLFSGFMILIIVFARPLYQLIAPGFDPSQLEVVVRLARILIFAQAFFLLSYFLTAVLESQRRFLIPAIAPLFYNLGIITGTIVLASKLGIYAPAVGAVIGASCHFAIQIPLATHLGFRFQGGVDYRHPGLKKIARLAWPRVIELGFLQVSKGIELFLASLIGFGAYTYLAFANSLQLVPVSLFGTSIAKASLPTLAHQVDDQDQFQKTFLASFGQILFLTVPLAVFLAVLRIPLVRLFFGASRFDWESTVQTSFVLSAFCLGIPFQALIFLLNRAFYALQNTLVPVVVSVSSILLGAGLGVILILGLGLPVWGLALAASLTSIGQFCLLLFWLDRKTKNSLIKAVFRPGLKIAGASFFSGLTMYVLLKIFDRSAWDQRLSFLGQLGLALPTSFQLFVLDTRYIASLIMLTILVALSGGLVYFVACLLLQVKELVVLTRIVSKAEKLTGFSKKFWRKEEVVMIDEPPRGE